MRGIIAQFKNGAKLIISNDGRVIYAPIGGGREKAFKEEVGEENLRLIPETHEENSANKQESFLNKKGGETILFTTPVASAFPVSWTNDQGVVFGFLTEGGTWFDYASAEKGGPMPENINVRSFSYRIIKADNGGYFILAAVSDRAEGLNGAKGFTWVMSSTGKNFLIPKKIPFNFKYVEAEGGNIYIETDANSAKLLHIELDVPEKSNIVEKKDLALWEAGTRHFPKLGHTSNASGDWFSNSQPEVLPLNDPAATSAFAAANQPRAKESKMPLINGPDGKTTPADEVVFKFAKKYNEASIIDFGYKPEAFKPLVVSLLKKESGSIVVTGESGGGKTIFVNSFVKALLRGDLKDRGFDPGSTEVITFSASSLTGGNRYNGMDEANAQALLKYAEWKKANGKKLVVVIDEIHALNGSGVTEGNPNDMITHMLSALADGTLKIVGTTTEKNYTHFAARTDVERRCPSYPLAELTKEEVVERVGNWLKVYHNAVLSQPTREFIVTLATDADAVGAPLSRATKLMDTLFASAEYDGLSTEQLEGNQEYILKVATDFYRYNVQTFRPEGLDENVAKVEEKLKSIIGFQGLKERLLQFYIRSASRSVVANKAQGGIVFIGPKGLGKTTFAETIASALGRPLVKISMSKYSDKEMLYSDVARAAKTNPYSVIFFDEIGEASHEIQVALNSLLDSSKATADLNYGKSANTHEQITVDLSKLFTIAATNKGDSVIEESYRNTPRMGFHDPAEQERSPVSVDAIAKRAISEGMVPSLLDRFELVPFEYYSELDFRAILDHNYDLAFEILNTKNQSGFKPDPLLKEGYINLLMKKHFNPMASPRVAIKQLFETLENYYAYQKTDERSPVAKEILRKACRTYLEAAG